MKRFLILVMAALGCITEPSSNDRFGTEEEPVQGDEDQLLAGDDTESAPFVVDELASDSGADPIAYTLFPSAVACSSCTLCVKWCTNLETGARCKYGCCMSNFTYGPAQCVR